ncbi:glycosyltransferase family 4 protein [Teredinibacter sp. KSP-S5-2]|uniref:glycosyltransferase family 4 protein n=1 Tax=Teredinibacter sp. KSP-S5-2 TaxID=3034506 RepID=UPI0029342853|nr:glycosyltransferase family 4 protein [Teredinibacter sp. KSP-S5-2]WNO08826.1 glycosyltransferase family 4 protein [Teredinibacter sp. KSP-S5-2]
MLKIALLGYRSHPYVGGQGIYLKYLSQALADMGHQVDVYSGPPYPELDSSVNLIKVPSLNLYEHENHVRALRWHHLKSYTDTYEWWEMLTGGFGEPYTFGRRVYKLLKKQNYDIIHDNQSLSFGILKLHQRHKNVVCTIHHPIHRDRDLAIEAAKDKLYKSLAKRWYSFINMQEKVVSKIQHVVTVSETSQRDIAECFNRCSQSISVIPNGIDTKTFKPLGHIEKRPYRVITTASSDQPLKGLKYLLEAFAQLKNQCKETHLVIIGKLKENGDAARLISKYQLQNAITFKHGLSTPELVEEYNKAVVAVCPSLYEGFGLPAAEAMACGLPVVSTDGGALPEVVGDAGVIVPAANAPALANELLTILSSEQQRKDLSIKGRKRIEEQFCWSRVAQQMTDFYQSQVIDHAHG